jgi:methionine-rich copper-binding protein CopC
MADTITHSTATTASLTVNGNSGISSIDVAYDQDWWRVTLTAGISYEFRLNTVSTTLDPYLRLLNASGTELASNDDDTNSSTFNSLITFTPQASGTYYLSAQGYENSTGSYSLSAVATDSIAASTATTASLTVNGVGGTSSVNIVGDQDWWRVTLTAGISYEFRLNTVSTTLDPYLRLLNASGTELASNDDDTNSSTFNSLITFTPQASGTYYLSAQGYENSTGSYSLSAVATDSIAASTATTASLTVNSVGGTSSVNVAGDQDWWRVTLIAGISYEFRLNAASTTLDPYLRLLNASGGQLVSNDDWSGSLNSYIVYTPSTTGAYYLAAQGYNSTTGAYTISATKLDTVPAAISSTAVLTVNGGARTSTIDTSNDQDWWKVTLTAGVSYDFRLNTASGTLDPILRLLNSAGTQLTSNDDGGGNLNSLVTFTPQASGTYYLSAQGYNGSTGGYSLSAVTSDNIAASTATNATLTVNGALGASTVGTSGDQDWWKINLTAGLTYVFQLNTTSSGLDPYLRLLNSTGMQLAYSDDDGGGYNSRIVFTASTSGSYYLSAQGIGTTTGTYSLRASATDTIPCTASTTAIVAANGTNAVSRVDAEGDRDWWRANLVAGTTYTIKLLGSPSGANSGLTLSDPYIYGIYNSSGGVIAGTSNDDYGSSTESQVVFTPTTSGIYYFSSGAYGSTTGSYALQLTARNVAEIPNSTATTATLAVNSRASNTIGIAGDQDWFRVNLIAGQRYVVDLMTDQSSARPLSDPYFRGVYLSNGTTLLANSTNDDYGSSLDSRAVFTAPNTGTYYLAAGGYGSYTGDYIITLSALSNTTDIISANTSTTGTITLGSTGINGTIDVARDDDWYRISLTAGQSYVINLRGADSGQGSLIDPRFVGVYNSSGAIIAGTGNDNYSNSPDAQITFRPLTSGVYYLAAGGANDLTGSYRLTIEPTLSSDISDNVTTTAVLNVGGSVTSQIDNDDDVDWIKIRLTQGQTYQFRLRGAPTGDGTLADPILAGIYNSAGQVLPGTYNDDFGGSLNAQTTLTPAGTGDYYIAATGYGSQTGTYKLSASLVSNTDTSVPLLLSANPTDNATGVPINSNITLRFNESVRAGSGNILLSGNNGQSLSISVTSNQVSFSGDTMTVNPSANLTAGVQYTLTMGAGVVKDMAGNNFAGITNTTQCNFTTATQSTSTVDNWTIFVYMAADNNLEQFAIRDLNEMESVILPSNVNVVTMVDRIGGYDNSNGDWTNTRQGSIIHDNNSNTVSSFSSFSSLGELNTGNPQTLTNFINWGASHYVANHYALVIWDHGGGLSGAAWDDTTSDHLSANELSTAINNAVVDHFDFIGFDACEMGMLEEAWDLRNLTSVFVGSEEVIPGDGWAYDRWLNTLATNPGQTALQLATNAISSYGVEYAGQEDITLSAIQTSALTNLDTSLDQFITDALSSSTTSADWTAMRTAASRTTFFGSATSNFRDLGNFMEQVNSLTSSSTLKRDAANVLSSLNNTVFAETGTVAGANGLSIYLPYGATAIDSSYTAANHSFLAASSWENFLAVL